MTDVVWLGGGGRLVNRAFKRNDVTSKKNSLHPTNLVMLRRKNIHTNKQFPSVFQPRQNGCPVIRHLHPTPPPTPPTPPTPPAPQHVLQRKRAENKAVKVLRNEPSINKLKRLVMKEKKERKKSKKKYIRKYEKGLLRTPAPGGGASVEVL